MIDTHLNPKTVRLARGRHSSPRDGVCVMELASLLAGEPFSDRPATASPVISALLRAYNDWVGEDRRQELYPYAAAVVGTRASAAVERQRLERLAEFAGSRRRMRHPLASALRRLLYGATAAEEADRSATLALRELGRPRRAEREAVRALLDELLAIGAKVAELDRCPVAPPSSPLERERTLEQERVHERLR